MLKKTYKAIKNPGSVLLRGLNFKVFRDVPDSKFLTLKYKLRTGETLDLKNPKSYNEKLQWLKLNDRNPEYTSLVDKYEVRKYISKKIGNEYLIPLLGVWKSVEDINFDKLPNSFVLKCNHNSAGLVICKNKKELDIDKAKSSLKKQLKKNFYYKNREWPYKNVSPRIIGEKLMVDESGKGLKDYKFYCFHGEPKVVQVDYNRFTNHKRNLYDLSWNYIPASIQYKSDPKIKIKKPEKLDIMIELARILSKNYYHVRIDFYSINGQIYFGEITFYSEAGFGKFQPKEFDIKMGSLIKLPI